MVDRCKVLRLCVATTAMISLVFLFNQKFHRQTTTLQSIFNSRLYKSIRPILPDSRCSNKSQVDIKYNRTNHVPGIWVNTGGSTLLDRISLFNDALGNISSALLNRTFAQDRNESNKIPSINRRIVLGASENFLEILANYSDIETVFLSWSQFCPNLIIQDYYPLTGSDLFCSWIETPGMIANQLPYDVVYNRTCNRNHSIAVQPQPLDPLVLHAKYIRQGWYWPNSGKSFPRAFYTGPPSYTTYLHLIINGIVSTSGDVFTNDIQFIPYDKGPFSNERPKFPGNIESIQQFDEVFVMTQWFGVLGSIYHTMVEDIPRLALYVEFLRKHPHIVIASSEPFRERMNEIMKILGLDTKRLVSGWCRAKLVYLPRPATLFFPNVQEVQVLSRYYHEYIDKNFPRYTRNKIILIKRTKLRKFTEQKEIEEVVMSAANHFNLSYALYRDDPTPSFNDTMILFKSAVMVVAPHGAALSNLIFSDPGTYVVEAVCHAPIFILCFQRLVHILGQRWHRIPSTIGCQDVLNVTAVSINDTVWRYLEIHQKVQNITIHH